MPPRLIGMEACVGANHLSRKRLVMIVAEMADHRYTAAMGDGLPWPLSLRGKLPE